MFAAGGGLVSVETSSSLAFDRLFNERKFTFLHGTFNEPSMYLSGNSSNVSTGALYFIQV